MELIKSIYDEKNYKFLKLKNNLKVIIVNDKKADMSAACMLIRTGYRDDTVSGITHFLEHMLFMGTKDYPKENDYFEFISKNGGMSNAGTGFDQTQYYFNIIPDKFLEALKIFSSFFTNPLLNKNSIQKEINAVHSEHSKNINNDGRRIFRLLGEVVNTDHPLKNFGTGNSDTLNIPNIRDKLIDFYNCFYKPENMCLVVHSKEEIDIIESEIIKNYSNVGINIFNKNNNNCNDMLKKSKYFPFRFNDNKDIYIETIPIKDDDDAILLWQVKNDKNYYKFKPYDYIFYFFNNESKGSLYFYLKEKNLINNIYCETLNYNDKILLFCINVNFTEEGFKKKFEIIKLINDYFYGYVLNKFQDFVYNDLKSINEIKFKFKSEENPISYVQDIANSINEFEIKDILYGNYRFDKISDEIIKNYKEIFKNINNNKLIILN